MNLEIRHLEMVQAIAEEGTVTRAATRLHLTQSALSHQLLGIEEKLSAALFQRIGRRMVITPAGERLFSAATYVLAELRRAEHDIGKNGVARDGMLRISTECYTCYHWLPQHLKVFSEAYPGVEVRIAVEATHQPFEALLDGKIDVGIVSSRIQNARIAYSPLFKDELVVVMNPEHHLAHRDYITAQDFATEHLIAYSVPREQLTVFQSVLVPAGVTPRALSHVQLTEAIIEMVKGGIGIGVLARWAVEPQLQAGSLVAVSLTRRGIHRTWSAATLRSRSTPPYIQKFVSLMRKNGRS